MPPLISVPQSDGLPPVAVEILRDGDAIIVSDPAAGSVSPPILGLPDEAPVSATVSK
jgi:hypothetical protein